LTLLPPHRGGVVSDRKKIYKGKKNAPRANRKAATELKSEKRKNAYSQSLKKKKKTGYTRESPARKKKKEARKMLN